MYKDAKPGKGIEAEIEPTLSLQVSREHNFPSLSRTLYNLAEVDLCDLGQHSQGVCT